MKIGIDVTFVKPKKSGGVEVFIRNLLDGFLELKDENEYFLLTAKDNDETFCHYESDRRVKCIPCDTNANDVAGHLLWQNTREWSVLKNNDIDFCYFPVYEMPIFCDKNIKTVTTIHDIQAVSLPQNFKLHERIWFRLGWGSALKNADATVAISNFTKEDIKAHFKKIKNLVTIYNPIDINPAESNIFKTISKKYNIKKNKYFYTVSSLYPHKNLATLISMMRKIKIENISGIPHRLLVSGVGGTQKEELIQMIKEQKLEDVITLTGFVSDEERNALIESCNIFLFSSIFEGFGVPPIEAMMLGARVLSTKCASLKEVTKNKCAYVDDPKNPSEWIEKIISLQKTKPKKINFPEYSKSTSARSYLNLFYRVYDN